VLRQTTRSRRRATTLLSALTAALVVTTGMEAAVAAPGEKVGPPGSIASMGDSITRGFHTGTILTDVPANSWSTGTNATVNSLYSRIRAVNPGAVATNNALTGAKMADLPRQAANTVRNQPDVVTILLGANDACTSTEAAMTPVGTYESQFRSAMETLRVELPDTQVLVASVPDIHRLWQIGHTSGSARFAWALYGICQSMLAQPTSTTAANVDRRARVRQRVMDYNAVLRDVCAEYVHCRYDDDAAFNTQFTLADMSSIDYFHPNVSGQAKAAAVLADALLDLDDVTAPTSVISNDRDPDGVDGWYRDDVRVSITSDAADLSGSEYDYRLSGAAGDLRWTRYTGPLTITDQGESAVTARSVDRAGNIEGAQTHLVHIDKEEPGLELACPGPVTKNAPAHAQVTATDDLSGFAENPNGAFAVDTSQVGTQRHEVEVQDRAGNTAGATCEYTVIYDFSGLAQPVNGDGSSVFKVGSTIPLKFTLTDFDGARQSDAEASWTIRHVTGDVAGTAEERWQDLPATPGRHFGWSGAHGQYVHNLPTRTLTPGTYELAIHIDGVQTESARFSLR
jgi:lysophospholipase L1-like esterase